jgi:hypothetical protein
MIVENLCKQKLLDGVEADVVLHEQTPAAVRRIDSGIPDPEASQLIAIGKRNVCDEDAECTLCGEQLSLRGGVWVDGSDEHPEWCASGDKVGAPHVPNKRWLRNIK